MSHTPPPFTFPTPFYNSIPNLSSDEANAVVVDGLPVTAATATSIPQAEMSKDEIAVRLENTRLQEANRELMKLVAELDAAARYGEQCDEGPVTAAPVATVAAVPEPVADVFPVRALRFGSTPQRIGLLTLCAWTPLD